MCVCVCVCVCVCNENKKNDDCVNFCGVKVEFIRLYQKTGRTDFDELQVSDFVGMNRSQTNGTLCVGIQQAP